MQDGTLVYLIVVNRQVYDRRYPNCELYDMILLSKLCVDSLSLRSKPLS